MGYVKTLPVQTTRRISRYAERAPSQNQKGFHIANVRRKSVVQNREEITVTKLPTVRFLQISKRLYLIEKIGRGERI